MKRRTSLFAVGAVALVAPIAGAGIAIAGGGGDQPLTGADLDRAVAAALEHTGGGTVTESEVGDDGAAYSVEIRLDDGSQVEVQLDAQFNVMGDEVDDDGANDFGDGPGDDRPPPRSRLEHAMDTPLVTRVPAGEENETYR